MMTDPQMKANLYDASGERWPDDVAQTIETTRRLEDARHVAVMPDVHLAKGFCIGTVLATRRLIYPSAVGSDIGCGMLAIAFNSSANALEENNARRLLKLLPNLVPWNRQPDAQAASLSTRLRFCTPKLDRVLQREGRVQLGTLGRGNHFLELQRDAADDRLWLMVHTGSRGLGQAITSHHLSQAIQRSRGKPYLDSRSDAGSAYLHDMNTARAYARLNRIHIAHALGFAIHQLLGVSLDTKTVIHTDHNHVKLERIQGRWHWVHRKGAAPSHTGQQSVVPGSMATCSYHIIGKGYTPALCSCAHGAGRRRNRTTSRRLTPAHQLVKEMQGVWFNNAAAAHLTDEAPSAYKDVETVMRKQRKQVRIRRKLYPVLSYKGVS